ncbi:MAG: UDP-N-acetylglucosamine 2-epimerase (non-hydrolyzing) [Pirellulales bacterium]|nr:UDP-N-acetylglucosamine 2-epimerase (non-hydrolyzing) [Pirellulales bacterium]
MRLRPLLVVGTRAEAVKMAPVALACRAAGSAIDAALCTTGQHGELVADVLAHFACPAQFDLAAMRPRQSLAQLTARLVARLDRLAARLRPDCLVAVGDTNTVLATALVACSRRCPLVHVEAGLRTGNLQAPWPEEFNRRVTTLAATLHCAATPAAAARLIDEGIAPAQIRVTGNTAIDALQWSLASAARDRRERPPWISELGSRRLVLVTCHRRESFGRTLAGIVRAIRVLAKRQPDVVFIWPVHPNPHVVAAAGALERLPNVWLLPPLGYGDFVELMRRAELILTDSGGIQEEAPSLGVPCLVLREVTERPEAVECGANELVGTAPEAIVRRCSERLRIPRLVSASHVNPYGDGHAAERIVEWMLSALHPALARLGGAAPAATPNNSQASSR